MILPIELCILFGVAALCSSVGFYRSRYFMSVGYGLSMAGCGAILWVLFRETLNPWTMAGCIILVVYGIRLAGFLLLRETGSKGFQKYRKTEMKELSMDMGFRLILWIFCGVLYSLMLASFCYRLKSGLAPEWTLQIAVSLMGLGVLLETAADWSKGHQKKKYPGEVCRRGLYHLVRCPNYFGEILLWTGTFISGIPVMESPGQWILALIGYLGILFVMFSAARRMELRQNRKYGRDPRYQRYVKRVPILIPLIPLRSLRKWKFLF